MNYACRKVDIKKEGQIHGPLRPALLRIGRDANMTRRWAGTVLLEAEKRFNRIQGYREMPLLVNALGNAVDSQDAVA
jgi:hypothetical protein